MEPREAPRDTGEEPLAGSFHETRPAARCLPSVIRRHVLAAVDAGVAAGDDDAARAALGRIDWILRGQARRRFEQAWIDAALATGVIVLDAPAAARHVLRAAALILRWRRDVDLADRDQVARAYEAAAVGAQLALVAQGSSGHSPDRLIARAPAGVLMLRSAPTAPPRRVGP